MPYKRKRSYSAPGASKRYRKYTPRKRRYSRARNPYRMKRTTRRRGIASAMRTQKVPKVMRLKNPAFADSLLTTFTFRAQADMTTPADSTGTWRSIMLNSLDPTEVSASGLTGTPNWGETNIRYLTLLLNNEMYRSYRVYRTTVEVVLRGENATTDCLAAFTISRSPNGAPALQDLTTTTRTGAWDNAVLPDWTVKTIEGENAGAGLSIARFKADYKIANGFGVKKGAIYSEDNYAGNGTAASPGLSGSITSPLNQMFLNVGTFTHPQETAAATKVIGEIYIKYHVKLESNYYNKAPATIS